MWGRVSCGERAQYLKSRYNTQNAEDALMKDRRSCRNPPMRIYWRDDGVDEVENVFGYPRLEPEDVTTAPYVPPRGNVTIYFYDTLRDDVGEGLVEDTRRRYSHPNNTETNAQADIAVIDLFRTYPGRVYDPAAADVFVVPYPHASHCVSKPTGVWMGACKHIPTAWMRDGVFSRLEHYAGEYNRRHLFLNVLNQGNSHPTMRATPLTITIGPKYASSNIVVPYMNNLPSFQPGAVRGRGVEWWTRPRTYSMAYFFGISNSKMRNSPRVWRQHFMREVQENWNGTLGGLPYAIRVMTRGRKPPSRFFTYVYKDSVFCPTLPGDTPPQKRFFDVVLMGCIPVVLAFATEQPNCPSNTSWHQPGGQPIENSYPWIRGSNNTHPEDEIDYREFVVEVDGVENVRSTIEGLMRNYTEIRRRQLALMRYAPYFSYGVGDDAHRYPDAFSKILESLKYYADSL